MTYLAQAFVASFVTAVLIVWLRRPALRFGLVDHHGGRKRHGGTVPLTGGIALTLGFFAGLALSLPVLADYRVLFVSMLLLAAVGVLDDLGEVSARTKLGVQVLAAVLMTSWGNHFLTHLGDLFGRGQFELNNWAIPLTVFATVAVINGINMLDGIDGLAGGVAAIAIAWFALFAGWLADPSALKLLVVLLGAVVGFLVFNVPHPLRGRSRTFMGDTGALVLGFAITWFSIALTQRPGAAVPPVVMLWVVALVLFDVFTVTMRRVMFRRDPAAPDRAHVHHLLLRRGFSTEQTLAILLAASAALGAIGAAGWRLGVPERWLFAGFIAVGLAYLALFLFPARFMRWGRKRRRTGA